MNLKNLLSRLFSFYAVFGLLQTGLSSDVFACHSSDPQCRAEKEEKKEAERVEYLFRSTSLTPENPAKSTFIIFNEGAADHFVMNSVEEGNGVKRVDAIDSQKIRDLAKTCQSCNVVLLHIQRGGAHWYTANHPWATYLRVYSRGKKLLSKHVDVLNGADPAVLTGLVKAAERWFPDSKLHLIYRGHAFHPAYLPEANQSSPDTVPILPFDYNFKNSGYGADQFSQSLAAASLSRPLASITLAACSMAYLEVASKLAPWADTLIAPQVDIVETLVAGFGYSFLTEVRDWMSPGEVTQKISQQILSPFLNDPMREDYMMEASTSFIQLKLLREFRTAFRKLNQSIRENEPDFFHKHEDEIKKAGSVDKVLSTRYVDQLRAKGKSEARIQQMIQLVRSRSLNQKQVDLGAFLKFVQSQNLPTSILDQAGSLLQTLERAVQVLGAPPHSTKSGLSFDWPF